MSHPIFYMTTVSGPAVSCSLESYFVMIRWIKWAFEAGSPYCAPMPILAPKRNVVFVNILEGFDG